MKIAFVILQEIALLVINVFRKVKKPARLLHAEQYYFLLNKYNFFVITEHCRLYLVCGLFSPNYIFGIFYNIWLFCDNK